MRTRVELWRIGGIWGWAGSRSRWRGMWRFSAWDESGKCGLFQQGLCDETCEVPLLLPHRSRNRYGKGQINQLYQKKQTKKKKQAGRLQRIASSSNPSWKHAPIAASCQLTRLESSRKSSTYHSNHPAENPTVHPQLK